MIRLFTGWDAREAAGWHAFVDSVYKHSTIPVSITRLPEDQRNGSNAFTFSRFMIPELCNYEGWAIYMDGADMLCRGNLADLFRMQDETKAVSVVKHDYQTKFSRKYIGTSMESPNINYPRKNWSSVILWNCAHPSNREMYGELHRFGWLKDKEVGELPRIWNWLADEFGYNQEAKILHYTAGAPVQMLHMA